jgi:hypothetical protein
MATSYRKNGGTIMEKTMTMFLYVSAIVVGSGMLRYFYGRRPTVDDLRSEESAARSRKAYRRAIGRWENEGGAMLASQNYPRSYTRSLERTS